MRPIALADLTADERALAAADWGMQHPTQPTPGYFPDQPEEWLRQHNAFNQRAEKGDLRVLFLGDSITHGWTDGEGAEVWARHFSDLPAANFGIGGDRTQQLLWRIDHGNLEGISPDFVVLLIGVNNLWSQSHSPEEVSAGIAAVVDRIRAKLVESVILLYGIFPAMEFPDHPVRKDIEAVNALSALRYAEVDGVRFIDIGDHFLASDGSIDSATMPDFCHLSAASYQKWADSILSYLGSSL